MKFILASNNQKKLTELRAILSEMDVEVVSQREAGVVLEVEETGTTFEENALLKAEGAMKASGLPAIADDSGLTVDALGGEPGIYSARYGGETCESDLDRCRFLLSNLKGEANRAAQFVSSIVCLFPDGRTVCVRGECRGEILEEMRGEGGFGYDPLFFIPEYNMTMAEMPAELKNKISHRAKALGELKNKLGEINLK